ncbi:Gfo/Idh/MocA family oxidoreductase [Terrilactibacillus sp. S3-3]|nr:Gfo/Idh/MocA family oxidoreductase [Terrilactibacillus sp. S3-3]
MHFATIGTSKITDSFIEAANKSRKMVLSAVYSRNKEKAAAFASKHRAERWYTSLEDLAQADDVEVVYVASPNALHFEQVKLMLNSNKHVICEKPIFTTLKEYDQAFAIAENHGVFLFEAIRNIQTPVFKRLKQELHRAGKIRSSILKLIQYSSRYDAFLSGDIPNVFFFSPEFAGGALEDLGVYVLYTAVGLFGKPKAAHYYPVMLPSGVDGSGTLILEYDDFVCTLLCSKIAHSSSPSEIHGEKGTFSINSTSDIAKLQFTNAHSKKNRDHPNR